VLLLGNKQCLKGAGRGGGDVMVPVSGAAKANAGEDIQKEGVGRRANSWVRRPNSFIVGPEWHE
jgi:hypothetical protein